MSQSTAKHFKVQVKNFKFKQKLGNSGDQCSLFSKFFGPNISLRK